MCFGKLKKMKMNNTNIPLPTELLEKIGKRNNETSNRKGVMERFVEGERLATRQNRNDFNINKFIEKWGKGVEINN